MLSTILLIVLSFYAGMIFAFLLLGLCNAAHDADAREHSWENFRDRDGARFHSSENAR